MNDFRLKITKKDILEILIPAVLGYITASLVFH